MTSTEIPFVYEECDIPEGMTLREYRAATRPPARPRLRTRLARRLGH